MAFTTNSTIASFGGRLLKLSHESKACSCTMNLNLYLPPQCTSTSPIHSTPVIFYLAGLTCTGDNGAEKGFFQSRAAQRGIAIVYPDTSPRGHNLPGEDETFDFGSGAGFYLDATAEPWKGKYNMYSYVTKELPAALFEAYEQLDPERVSIMGHSMGGHGALTCYLKNPGKYRSVSAFAPIANPSKCPWGDKAFRGYLASWDEWAKYDATELVKSFKGKLDILVDVGTSDNFYKQKQLLPENLVEAAKQRVDKDQNDSENGGVNLRYQDGYDHSYIFISTFGADHIDHAAKYLV